MGRCAGANNPHSQEFCKMETVPIGPFPTIRKRQRWQRQECGNAPKKPYSIRRTAIGEIQMESLGRWSAGLLILICLPLWAQEELKTPLKYQEPPKGIIELVDVRPTPSVEVSPGDRPAGRWLLIEAISGLPLIADLAQPELRLAGLRFNPRTNGPSRGRYMTALSLKALPDGDEKPVAGLPAPAKIRFVGWAPDARHIFFVNVSDATVDPGLSLWFVDVESAQARRVP